MRKKIISLSMALAICLTVGLYSINKVLQGRNNFISNNSMKLFAMDYNADYTKTIGGPGEIEPE